MTREEIEKEIKRHQARKQDGEWRYAEIVKYSDKMIAALEKELKELEVEVYEPMYLKQINTWEVYIEKDLDHNIKIDRHNTGEELKKLISEENAKQGWKVDWEDEEQMKYNFGHNHHHDTTFITWCKAIQNCENELYFSEQSSKDQDFLDKIKPLWLKWKGITNV